LFSRNYKYTIETLTVLTLLIFSISCTVEDEQDIQANDLNRIENKESIIPPNPSVTPVTPAPSLPVATIVNQSAENIVITKYKPTLDLHPSTNGRWRGLAICEYSLEKWGGGEYELGNGKFSALIDFTITQDLNDPDKRIFNPTNRKKVDDGPFWFDWSDGGRILVSSNISDAKITFTDYHPKSLKQKTWEGNLIAYNSMHLTDEWNECSANLSKSEEVLFDSYSPKYLLDYVDGVSNDSKYAIPGLLSFPASDEEKYPLMIMIQSSGCGYGDREFTYGADFRRQGVAILEMDNCQPRGLSEENPISRNWNTLTAWMGAADALFALRFLQDHPKVDSTRIGITGFSWGGQVAFYTGIDLIRKSIVGDNVDFALRAPYYLFCRQFDDPQYSPNKLHIFQGELDSVPPNHCIEMADSFNNRGYDVSVDTYQGAYHVFDEVRWNAGSPKVNHGQWWVTDKCYFWVDRDYKRSWRLDDMRIEFDDYTDWNFGADPFYKQYERECEHSGPIYGRNDAAARLSAAKLSELIEQHLK
jgi:dienelactone hydrolase